MVVNSFSPRYEILPGLLLGFHGTDHQIVEQVLAGDRELEPSQNSYDWLGHGVYFWEYSPQRALDFARQASANPRFTQGRIAVPAVIGAVIDPGRCLNFLEASALDQLRESYKALKASKLTEWPKNVGEIDKLQRHLDCAVIELLHAIRENAVTEQGQPLPPYQTVRGAFWEGSRLYPGAGFRQKNHVQLVVRDQRCIKGYFRPFLP